MNYHGGYKMQSYKNNVIAKKTIAPNTQMHLLRNHTKYARKGYGKGKCMAMATTVKIKKNSLN